MFVGKKISLNALQVKKYFAEVFLQMVNFVGKGYPIMKKHTMIMKKIFGIQLMVLAAMICSCGGNKSAAPVFVTDEYGVVEKINQIGRAHV